MPRLKTSALIIPALTLSMLFLCHCQVWTAHKTLKEARLDIEKEEGLQLNDASQYHFDAAKGLLEAAEKQYEDADFKAATTLALQAEDQVERSRRLREFHKLFSPETYGGTN